MVQRKMANQTQASAVKAPKKSIIEVFMNGAKKGFYIGVEQMIPAVILGYVIVEFLQLSGLLDLLGTVFSPIMALFGLPGEAIVVLISAFLSKAAGAASAANMYAQGILNAAQCTILVMPCMLMGTLVGHFARIILVADVNKKHRGLMLAVPLIDSVLAMWAMRLILTLMGAM